MKRPFHTGKSRGPQRISVSEMTELLSGTYKKHRWRLIGGFTALLLVDFLQLIVPRIIKFTVDSLSTSAIEKPELLK